MPFIEQPAIQRIHPQKFALWVGIVGMIMMFAALTSAYIVRRSAGNWVEFKMPDAFFYSTVFIVLSSVTLHGALVSFKEQKEKPYKMFLSGTFLLGFSFLVAQYSAWNQLMEQGIYLRTNASSSFMYMLTLVHAGHILAGLGALSLAIIHAFVLRFENSPKRILRLELTTTFWHFLGVLWIYLLVFFMLQQ